jgi:hypothetical protein
MASASSRETPVALASRCSTMYTSAANAVTGIAVCSSSLLVATVFSRGRLPPEPSPTADNDVMSLKTGSFMFPTPNQRS